MAKKYNINRHIIFDGKKYAIHADTEVEFEVNKAMKLRDLEEGRVLLNKDMLFSVWAERCLNTYKTSCSAKRLTNYKSTVRANINPEIGHMKLRNITPLDCQEVLNEANIEKSGYTVKQCKYLLNFIFERAQENGLLLRNPAEKLTLPALQPAKKGRALTKEELKAFLDIIGETDRFRIFELMYHCGCRSGEAMICKGSDILRIEGNNILHIRGTKTENSDRMVPIPDELYLKIKDTPPESPIAPNTIGNYYKDSTYRRARKTLKREMNIKLGCKVYRNELIPPFPLATDFRPYYLRHTYCVNLQKKGVDIRTAQALMGHADITMTANIYTHSDIDLIIGAAALISPKL